MTDKNSSFFKTAAWQTRNEHLLAKAVDVEGGEGRGELEELVREGQPAYPELIDLFLSNMNKNRNRRYFNQYRIIVPYFEKNTLVCDLLVNTW